MAKVRSKGTRPEMTVRRALWAAGLRYRVNYKTLPGRPDIVFSKKRIAIFVHGCFWHGHLGCPRHTIPKTRSDWWRAKIDANRVRDAKVQAELEASGWTVVVVWECETASLEGVQNLVDAIIGASKR